MMGAVSSNPITCNFVGDSSLSKGRCQMTDHLENMGAIIYLTKNDYLPVFISRYYYQ